MNIVYASDDKFVDVLGVSMISLFENNKGEDIRVFILADNIKPDNCKILHKIAEEYSQQLEMISVNVDDFSKVELDILTWSKAAFSRMFLGTILKNYNMDRVIYLDCDIIINHCIKELWNFELGEKTLGMVVDPVCVGHKKNVGIDANKPYFNSGVLLIDLKKWQYNDCENKLQQYALEKNGKTPYVDQGLINGALKDYIQVLPLKYNVITVYLDYTYKELLKYRKLSGYFYSEKEIQSATETPYIIHFTKSIFTERPWVINSTHKEKEKWEYYKSISPWKDRALNPSSIKGARKIYVQISQKLPRSVNIFVQSLLHSYIKPLVDRL